MASTCIAHKAAILSQLPSCTASLDQIYKSADLYVYMPAAAFCFPIIANILRSGQPPSGRSRKVHT